MDNQKKLSNQSFYIDNIKSNLIIKKIVFTIILFAIIGLLPGCYDSSFEIDDGTGKIVDLDARLTGFSQEDLDYYSKLTSDSCLLEPANANDADNLQEEFLSILNNNTLDKAVDSLTKGVSASTNEEKEQLKEIKEYIIEKSIFFKNIEIDDFMSSLNLTDESELILDKSNIVSPGNLENSVLNGIHHNFEIINSGITSVSQSFSLLDKNLNIIETITEHRTTYTLITVDEIPIPVFLFASADPEKPYVAIVFGDQKGELIGALYQENTKECDNASTHIWNSSL